MYRIFYLALENGLRPCGKAGTMHFSTQVAQPVVQGLHDLTFVFATILGFVVAGAVGYFYYAAHMKLEP